MCVGEIPNNITCIGGKLNKTAGLCRCVPLGSQEIIESHSAQICDACIMLDLPGWRLLF